MKKKINLHLSSDLISSISKKRKWPTETSNIHISQKLKLLMIKIISTLISQDLMTALKSLELLFLMIIIQF